MLIRASRNSTWRRRGTHLRHILYQPAIAAWDTFRAYPLCIQGQEITLDGDETRSLLNVTITRFLVCIPRNCGATERQARDIRVNNGQVQRTSQFVACGLSYPFAFLSTSPRPRHYVGSFVCSMSTASSKNEIPEGNSTQLRKKIAQSSGQQYTDQAMDLFVRGLI